MFDIDHLKFVFLTSEGNVIPFPYSHRIMDPDLVKNIKQTYNILWFTWLPECFDQSHETTYTLLWCCVSGVSFYFYKVKGELLPIVSGILQIVTCIIQKYLSYGHEIISMFYIRGLFHHVKAELLSQAVKHRQRILYCMYW